LADIVIYTKPGCGYCHAAKALLDQKGADYTEIVASSDPAKKQEIIQPSGGRLTLPPIIQPPKPRTPPPPHPPPPPPRPLDALLEA